MRLPPRISCSRQRLPVSSRSLFCSTHGGSHGGRAPDGARGPVARQTSGPTETRHGTEPQPDRRCPEPTNPDGFPESIEIDTIVSRRHCPSGSIGGREY
jgi:hypothetical protein